ncbi:MAG TPA: acyl-CoA dehydrogenase family protein, partial [Caulobacteraceae bacterium]|nr:acyl-CoA dehydrogenase family protein [Caulobacteraceae bacterium]
ALHRFFDGESNLDEMLWARAAELGWLGVGLPDAHGGLDMGVQGLDVIYRALGRSGAPGPFAATLPAAQWLADVADEGLQAELLPRIIAGDLALAAPMAAAGSTVILADARLNGVSQPLLSSCHASLAIVSIEQGGVGGFALVDLDAPGVRFEPIELWDRTRRAGRVVCNNAHPIAVLPDATGRIGVALFRQLALAVAADSVGAGRRIADQTVEYLKTREQFGKPLASFQALKHRAADLMLALASAEELVSQAVEATAMQDAHADMWVDIAKAAASDAFKLVAEDCVQLHGGVGFTWEFDCHIFLKRALLNLVLSGDNDTRRNRAAEHLTGAVLAGVSTAELGA